MPRSAVSLARLLPAPDPAPADAPLLRAFEATRSEGAFEELVRRHGPMVLATCRRVLGNPDDAEDAFQAVFLVLARKASTVRGNLAGWLYAVSVRTARGVRIMRERRRKHETRASARSESAVLPESDHDLAAVIDEELARLPEHYREAVVLCELRGLSRKQAASELGIPEGTLSSRLAAARRKLAALLRRADWPRPRWSRFWRRLRCRPDWSSRPCWPSAEPPDPWPAPRRPPWSRRCSSTNSRPWPWPPGFCSPWSVAGSP